VLALAQGMVVCPFSTMPTVCRFLSRNMTKMALVVNLCVKKCSFVTFFGTKTDISGLQRVGTQAAVVFGKFFQPRSFL
jgi:hypothetical protein